MSLDTLRSELLLGDVLGLRLLLELWLLGDHVLTEDWSWTEWVLGLNCLTRLSNVNMSGWLELLNLLLWNESRMPNVSCMIILSFRAIISQWVIDVGKFNLELLGFNGSDGFPGSETNDFGVHLGLDFLLSINRSGK